MLAYCVDFPCNPPRIAAENCLVCGAKILAIRRTPLTKTASQQKRRFVLPLYHAKLLNCDYRIARFAPFGKRKTDFFAFCPQTALFRWGFRCIYTKDSPPGSGIPSQALRSPRPGCGTQRLLRCRLHPAGRCPNSSSLFPPLAAVVAVAPSRGAIGRPGNSVLTAGSSIWHKI